MKKTIKMEEHIERKTTVTQYDPMPPALEGNRFGKLAFRLLESVVVMVGIECLRWLWTLAQHYISMWGIPH